MGHVNVDLKTENFVFFDKVIDKQYKKMCCVTLTMCVKLETEDYTFKFLLF